MTKAELHAQIDSMTDEEAAQVKLIFAPEWPCISARCRPTARASGQ